MSTKLTSKGQVTIPKKVRDLLGLKPGSAVAFERSDDGEIIMRAAGNPAKTSKFARFRGHAGQGMSTDDILALTRSKD